MMQYVLKDYHSADIASVWQWQPARPEDVYYNLQMEIGPTDQDGGTIFQVRVATPEALRARAGCTGFLEGRCLLVVSPYSWPAVERRLHEIVRCCSGRDHAHVISMLCGFFLWEYEDHEFVE